MARNPEKDANKKAKHEMQEAVDKVIDEKKNEPIGTKKAEEEVAADLHEAAQHDTKKHANTLTRHTQKARSFMPSIRSDNQLVTQITVVESEPEKQAEALSLMTERARFMARQPGSSRSACIAASMGGASSTTSNGRAARSCSQLINRRNSGRSGVASMS